MPDLHPAFLDQLDRHVAAHPLGFITVTDPPLAALSLHLRSVRRALIEQERRREVAITQQADGLVEVEILGEPADIRRVGPGVQLGLRAAGFLVVRGRAGNVAMVCPKGWTKEESCD